MKDLENKLRAAIVQGSPVLFDKKATTEKCVEYIREAGKEGAELIVFPESFIPCYPLGMTFEHLARLGGPFPGYADDEVVDPPITAKDSISTEKHRESVLKSF